MHLQTSEAFAEGQAGPGTLESDSERHVSSPHIAHGTLLDDSESHRCAQANIPLPKYKGGMHYREPERFGPEMLFDDIVCLEWNAYCCHDHADEHRSAHCSNIPQHENRGYTTRTPAIPETCEHLRNVKAVCDRKTLPQVLQRSQAAACPPLAAELS